MDDFSGLEYEHDSVTDDDVIAKINNLLSQFNLPTKVTEIQDITAAVFVVLYESLFSDRLPGIVRQPLTREDEIHNCQTVIDVLAADVIKDSLSHIRGVDIVEGKVQAINNLVDIFVFLFEYVIKQIESEPPTDTEDDQPERRDTEGPPEQAHDAVTRERSEARRNDTNGTGKGTNGNNRSAQPMALAPQDGITNAPEFLGSGDCRENITGVPAKPAHAAIPVSVPSPIRPDGTNSLLEQETINSTLELIQGGQKLQQELYKKIQPPETKVAWEDPENVGVTAGKFDFIGRRPVVSIAAAAVMGSAAPLMSNANIADPSNASSAFRYTSEAGLNFTGLSATMPLPQREQKPGSPRPHDKLRSTIGPVGSQRQLTPEKPSHHREEMVKGFSSSYGDLHQMVTRTAALTRAAIESSPLRMNKERSGVLDITDLSRERYHLPTSEAGKLAQELNKHHVDQPRYHHHPHHMGDVAEEPENKLQHIQVSTDQQLKPLEQNLKKPGSQTYVRREDRQEGHRMKIKPGIAQRKAVPISDKDLRHHHETRRVSAERGYASDSEQENNLSYKLKHRYQDIVDDVLSTDSDDLVAALKEHALIKAKKKLSDKLDELGNETLGDAQRHIETEDNIAGRKQSILQKMYEETYDEVAEEVQRRLMADTEALSKMEDYYKIVLLGPKKSKDKKIKGSSKTKGFLMAGPHKKLKSSRHSISSKTRHHGSGAGLAAQASGQRLLIKDEDDLMPLLLEEFPHLFLSEHTWHELWRKGIGQVESLTRAYEENKRRKSRAQHQLEEAAQKHELLANIVRKQVEHSRRLRDIQSQKSQQAIMKNKLHEKRIQSARARRYYNDFQVHARSKMLKRRSREEMIFKNLFKDGLAIQKERIQEIRRYTREQREKQAQRRQDEIDSMENYYRDQFDMLVQKIIRDQQDTLMREKAQQKVLDAMKCEIRRRMETEIKDIQSQLFRDDDDAYFRQLDADRLQHQLQLAKYQTRI